MSPPPAGPRAGSTVSTPATLLRIDGARLLHRLGELAAIGSTERDGVTRLAFSPEDVAGRELVASWLHDAGLDTHVDAAANLVGGPRPVRERPALVMGSHLDTVVDGGRLDGAYGVVAAVEVAATLAEAGHELHHDLRIVAFSDEEGANGTPGMLGSQALVGVLDPFDLERVDDEGVRTGGRVFAAGGDPDQIASAAWPAGSIAGYLELHIEQGPVLAEADLPIGVVEAITGRGTVEVVITGTANHAGTTPMDLRHDAMTAAAEVVLAVERLAIDGRVRVATAGHLRVTPNVRNVVAGEAVLGLDLRDVDDARIAAAVAELRRQAAEIAARRRVEIEVVDGQGVIAMPCDPGLVADVDGAARGLGLPTMRLPSGAGHDAQVVARVAPMAMIFVPSEGGISHNPAEHTEPDALVAGADVLLQALLRADERLWTEGRSTP